MKHWIIDPLDPLLFGTGKPFSAIPGSRAESRLLPTPAPLAGAMRTRHGSDAQGRFDSSRVDEVLSKTSHGPVFVELDAEGGFQGWVFPAPQDALPLPTHDTDGVTWWPMRPLRLPDGVSRSHDALLPVGPKVSTPSKPPKGLQPLWRWEQGVLPWLTSAQALSAPPYDPKHPDADLQAPGPQPEPRVHVGVDPITGTSQDGVLFSTEGRSWVRSSGTRLAMSLRSDGDPGSGTSPLGGEARLAAWHAGCPEEWPTIPEQVLKSARAGMLRVVLATPAHFEQGDRPTWMLESMPSGSTLVAQISGRPEIESGWNYAERCPKPIRRLAPAGAVFFVRLGGGEQDRERWAKEHWLQPISDDERARRDGYGLALLGVWTQEYPLISESK